MSDVLERLKADNPIPGGSPPPFDEVWARLEAIKPPSRRKRLGRAVFVGLVGLVPAGLVVWLAVATLFHRPPIQSVATGSPWLITYRTESMMSPAVDSGASFKSTLTTSQVWISGRFRHRLDTIKTRLESGGTSVSVHEMTGNGRQLENFQSGALDKLGAIDLSQDQGAAETCPLIDECAGGIAVDPAVEIKRLLQSRALVVIRSGMLQAGRRVTELVNGPTSPASPRYTLFVDPTTLFPILIHVQFGAEPPPRSSMETISVSDYRRVALTPANRSLLTMRPHPGAQVTCSGPGGGGPSRPASARSCPSLAPPTAASQLPGG